MSRLFVDRERELGALEERYASGRAEFVVIYGRRRVGKTALMLKFLEGKRGVYLLARETSEQENLKRFSQKLAERLGDDFLLKNPLRSWDAFFEYLARIRERMIIAIDEFPYLVRASPALPSVLQEYWDEKLSETKLFLIICGSSVSMMEGLLGYRSPMYGRRTAQLRLGPLGFSSLRSFFPRYAAEDLVKVYGILGGNPAYLLEFDDELSVEENLRRRYFRTDSILYQDALFVLREELEDPRNYFAIVEAVARGKTTLGEIVNETGLDRGLVGNLSVLRELDLVRREVPVTESYKSRRGRYRISDFYFNFWFRFVYPNADLIESGSGDALVEIVAEELNEYLGLVFEEVARQFISELDRRGELPLRITKLGSWWYRGEEVDLVALDERGRKALFAEVKWGELSEREVSRLLAELERKAERTGLNGYEKFYGVIAKRASGPKAEGGAARVWDLRDIDACWRHGPAPTAPSSAGATRSADGAFNPRRRKRVK